MPTGICDICKTTIDTFYEFLTRCRVVDKELRSNIPVLNINKDQTERQTKEIPDTYECAECPASFTSMDKIENHLQSHKQSSRFHCEVCSRSFTRQSALYSHIKRHFTMSKLAVEEKMNENKMDYVNGSDIMENEASSIGNVESNIRTETSDQYEVNEEIAESCTKSNHAFHLLLTFVKNCFSIVDIIFTCELCSKTFTHKTALHNHIETHSRTVHVCPREDCNKTYVTISSLRNHERKHLGIHSFLCMVCGEYILIIHH